MVTRFTGKTVLLLGGTAGVGLATATHFAQEGAHVTLLGRNAARGQTALTQIHAAAPGAVAKFLCTDAADPAAAMRAAEAAGPTDILVCSTGPSHPPCLLKDIPAADMASLINEIILPPLHMIKAVLPDMEARKGGVIITVASDAAKLATPGETLIGAAMAAITMFCRAAAVEEKRHHIRINILTPSLIANSPGAALIATKPFSAKLFAKAAQLAQLGVPESIDLAALTLFLASDEARRITGQAISVNGGISVA